MLQSRTIGKWEYDTSLCLYNIYYKTENIYYEESRGWERPEIRENYEFEQRRLSWIDAKAIYLKYIQKEKSNNNIVSFVSQKHIQNNIAYQMPPIGKELKKSISDLKRTIVQLEKILIQTLLVWMIVSIRYLILKI